MKLETNSTHWIVNGAFQEIPENMRNYTFRGQVVYEVIRVRKGRPVFLKAHLKRLENSVKLLRNQESMRMDYSTLESAFMQMVEVNRILDQNIRIVVWDINESQVKWCMFPIESYYPDLELYTIGVKTEVLHLERENPNAKLFHRNILEEVQKIRAGSDIYEVLLVDQKSCLTEGSRSNLFFVKEGQGGESVVYSAPEADILHGITRLKLKSVLETEGIRLIETEIPLEDIKTFAGAFLTGTSIHVLPISSISSTEYDSSKHPVIQRIIQAFEEAIEMEDTHV